jgi:hypothetical protein
MSIPNEPPAISINPPSPQALERIDSDEESIRRLVAEKQEMGATISDLREEIRVLRDQLDAAIAQRDRPPGP